MKVQQKLYSKNEKHKTTLYLAVFLLSCMKCILSYVPLPPLPTPFFFGGEWG